MQRAAWILQGKACRGGDVMEENFDRKPHFKDKCNQVGGEIHRLEHMMSKILEQKVKEAIKLGPASLGGDTEKEGNYKGRFS